METLWHGESESAFFNFEDLSKARKNNRAMYPPEIADLIRDKKINPKKEKDEIRFLGMDIATSRKTGSDSTAFFLGKAIPTKNGYEVTIAYAESMDGALVPEQALRFNRLKHYFDVDYGIIDTWNAGVGVYDLLAQGMDDPEWGIEYEPLSCMNDPSMAERCVYPNAPKSIYSMRANQKDNSDIAYLVKNLLKNNKIKLLIHEKESDDYLEKLDGYKNLNDELKVKFKVPYIQTSLLINEMINLEAEYNDSKQVKLKEPRSGRKDKYSSFSYMLYLVDYMNQKNRRNTKSDFNPADLFMVRKATRKTSENSFGF